MGVDDARRELGIVDSKLTSIGGCWNALHAKTSQNSASSGERFWFARLPRLLPRARGRSKFRRLKAPCCDGFWEVLA